MWLVDMLRENQATYIQADDKEFRELLFLIRPPKTPEKRLNTDMGF